jgi:hypothetical protein
MTTPEGKEMKFIAEPVVTAKGVANCAKVNQLDASQGSEVPVVNEFPDAFPEEFQVCHSTETLSVCSLRSIFDQDIIS